MYLFCRKMVTSNKFTLVNDAEINLLIGSENPMGNSPPPLYGVAFKQTSATYDYASSWFNDSGKLVTEMTTKNEIDLTP
jgi:hypothetical protein